MTAKKAVLQLRFNEERIRKKAFTTVSKFPGVTSITMDDKAGKMTIVGEVDVPVIVTKLRKICNADIVSVEAVKPPEKKPEPEKPAPLKPGEIVAFPVPINYYNPYQYHSSSTDSYYQYPYAYSKVVIEDPPSACVIM